MNRREISWKDFDGAAAAKERLLNHVGVLSAADLQRVEAALRLQLAL